MIGSCPGPSEHHARLEEAQGVRGLRLHLDVVWLRTAREDATELYGVEVEASSALALVKPDRAGSREHEYEGLVVTGSPLGDDVLDDAVIDGGVGREGPGCGAGDVDGVKPHVAGVDHVDQMTK